MFLPNHNIVQLTPAALTNKTGQKTWSKLPRRSWSNCLQSTRFT